MLPGVAIAARCAAAFAAMHPAPPAAAHGRRSARRPASGARAAARGVGKELGLWGRGRDGVRSIMAVRWVAVCFVHRVPFDGGVYLAQNRQQARTNEEQIARI